jgi:hypothetical protein
LRFEILDCGRKKIRRAEVRKLGGFAPWREASRRAEGERGFTAETLRAQRGRS